MGMNNPDVPKYCFIYTTKIQLLKQPSQNDIFRQWGWTISTFRNIMLQIHNKDTTSESSIRKWYFTARGMNNLYIPKYHTTKIQLLKQASEDDIFGNEDEQSYVPKYHASNARQSGWTTQTFGVYYPLQKEKKQFCCSTWILDKYLNTHTSTIFVTSRQKNIHPGQLKKYLSEGYAVDAVGSTSSNLEIFCLATTLSQI